jgi:membrane associated rhomboid family serine protease
MDTLTALSRGAPVSALLLMAITLLSGICLSIAPRWLERCMFRPYWLVQRGEYPTLVTSAFVHADVGHLLFNAITFWSFGFPLEREIGSARLLALYAIGLLASDAGTYVKHRGDPAYRCLGASGAILAVLFAAIVYFPKQAIFIFPLPLPLPAPLFAVAYLAYTYFASMRARGRVNHDAHLAGAVVGILFVGFTDPDAFSRAVRSVFG